MQIAALPVQEALAVLNSTASGLSTTEARRRLGEFGPNRIEAPPGRALWLRFADEFTHFFALILWLAAGLALVAEALAPGEGMLELAAAIVGVIAVNGSFSFWQEYRAERALEALRRLLPPQVEVLRDGAPRRVDAAEVVPGDVALLAAGDRVPADCRLIEAFAVRADLSTLSGESMAMTRAAEPDAQPNPLAARSLLLAGTALLSGQARALVYATGMRTQFGRIAHLTQTTRDVRSPLQREIECVSQLVTVIAATLGIAFFAIGTTIGLGFWGSAMFGIGIIVANVPEGLLPTVTLALAMATQRMARRNALVRHLPAVEALGSASVIVSDKTGTLTQNRMTVRQLFHGGAVLRAEDRDAAQARRMRRTLEVMATCHDVRPRGQRDGWLGDPMEVALVECAAAMGVTEALPRIGEMPFDHERRRMSVVATTPDGFVQLCKGALESILPVCSRWEAEDGVQPVDETARTTLLAAQDRMAASGLRVLALAWRPLATGDAVDEAGLTLCGLVGIEDPPRPEVPGAIARCRDAGIRVVMVTGDHPHTALAIGREIGLVRTADPVVLRGEELARLSATELQLALDADEILFARVSAEQKMRLVRALQDKGHVVAVTGDGVNDAPALKVADIGIAMGIAGTDVAQEAADIVLLDDDFATIVNAVEEGRAVFDNIRKFLAYILTSNVPEIVPYLAFVLFRIPLPLTVIQILAVDLGTDMLPALALGAEPPDREVMTRPPRRRNQRLLDRPLLARAYLFLGPLQALVAMTTFFLVLWRGGWRWGAALGHGDPLYLQATTACFAGIVVCQVVNLFLCRDPVRPALSRGLRGNRLLAVGLAFEIALLLAIVYTPLGNRLVGTAPLPAWVWLTCVPLALAMGVAEEVRKALVRRGRRFTTPLPADAPHPGDRARPRTR